MHKKKFSIFIGIFLILAIAVTIFLIQQGVLTVTKARPTGDPQRIQITNVSDSSFTVIFTTSLRTSAAIRLMENENSVGIILDDRDKSSGVSSGYYSHHITVPNLESQKTYSFSIISNGREYSSPAEYMATTGPIISFSQFDQVSVNGNVVLPGGLPASDTIIMVKAESSQTISSVTDTNGRYSIPTNLLRNEQLTEYIELSPDSQVFLDFFREQYLAKITATYKLSQNLPRITINQTYTFSPEESSLTNFPSEGFENIESVGRSSTEPTVTSPGENQSFIDQRPVFSGTGGANRKANISISQAGIIETVDISQQGSWNYRPQTALSQGNYSANFDIQDDNGISVRVTRSFSIFASGSQVSESATPSATPTFSPTPTENPSPTPTIILLPSQNPTQAVTPTTSQEPTPTVVVSSPTPTLSPPTSTPLPPIDKPGNFTSSALLGAFSIILIVAGAAIFFAL